MRAVLTQPILVENRTDGSAAIAPTCVAQSRPDG